MSLDARLLSTAKLVAQSIAMVKPKPSGVQELAGQGGSVLGDPFTPIAEPPVATPMPPSPRDTGPAMDLANMSSLGVTAVAVECACGRRESVDISVLSDVVGVPALKRRLRCTACGARPDWAQYPASGMGGALHLTGRRPMFLKIIKNQALR